MLDSTGLQVFGQGEWNADKHGRTPRQWRKLHLAIDVETGEILAHLMTDKDVGDITAVPGLLATVEGPLGSLIADDAYGGMSAYKAASIRQHDPPPDTVIPSRASSAVNVNNAGLAPMRSTNGKR